MIALGFLISSNADFWALRSFALKAFPYVLSKGHVKVNSCW